MPPVTHTHALFADQSQSILDDLAALGIGLFRPVAVICGGHLGINARPLFTAVRSRRMQGLEINRWSLRRPDETGLVRLMSASTGIAVIRWFAQQPQGRVESRCDAVAVGRTYL
jgi:hypothetical protein